MARIEDSPWAVSVAQVASRAGQSKSLDATFPAPSGIGDEIVGVDEGADVQVVGSFDSIDRKSTRLNSSHTVRSRMPSSA